MPADLLHYLGGPTGFSRWWWALAGMCAVVLVGYYAVVYVWTLPPARLRRIPLIREVHGRLLRRRFLRTVASTTARYRSGQLPGREAAAAISAALRSFLHLSTGAPVQYMHIDDIIRDDQLASTATAFVALGDAQFATEPADIDGVARATTEVIRTWT
ncbi:hypothetical protein [Mycobacterium sp.]|uniref:hypothetical protein n=1 Tax=Mycobacterium sp. TaxID=1785 RepID=UPI0025E18A8F|nr:hypothetical protein [Mycobacterium sp.]MBW0013468.1 hypothetical protein [Mycobacterium sp.]